MRNRAIFVMAAVAVVAALSAPTTTAAPSSTAGESLRGSAEDAVLIWNANAGQAALAACLAPTGNPLLESRIYAMMHVAIHDALNAIERRSRPYAFHGRTRSADIT